MMHEIIIENVEILDSESPDNMPIYSGSPFQAFRAIEPGMYPMQFATDDANLLDGEYGILVVTEHESFAVTCNYPVPMPAGSDT